MLIQFDCSIGLWLVKKEAIISVKSFAFIWCSICYFNFTVFYGALACKGRSESVWNCCLLLFGAAYTAPNKGNTIMPDDYLKCVKYEMLNYKA